MQEFAISFGCICGAALNGVDGFVVEDTADGNSTDAAVFYDVDDVFCFPGTAVSDDGDADGGGHFSAEFEIEAFAGSFAIDGGGEDFAGRPVLLPGAAHCSASTPVCSRPLSVKASHEPLACFPASMATTMVEDPKRREASRMSSGS